MLMLIINSLYFHFYLFYKNIYKDDDPILTTRLSLTAIESFLIIAITDVFSAIFLLEELQKWVMIAITLSVLVLNTFYFFTEKKVRKILSDKPLILNSNKVSIFFAWFIFSIGIIIMFGLNSIIDKILHF